MSNRLFRSLYNYLNCLQYQQIRYGHRLRGKPPTIARTIDERLSELNYRDAEVHFKVDIGLPFSQRTSKKMMGEWIKEVKQNREDPEVKGKLYHQEFLLDLDKSRDDWLKTVAPLEIRRIADHYGVFNDLFGDAYFHPVLPLVVDYDCENLGLLARVYRGNIISASETLNIPTIKYESEPNTFWSLLLTTPDGNLSKPGMEICHWFVGNIPGNSIGEGDLLLDYLRPIPARGIGYCRYIFVLYKQDKKIDFSEYRRQQPCFKLHDRDWSTLEFYRKHQDNLTPAGLSFFQTEWDSSLINFYHDILKMRSPSFEYDFPKPYIKPQVWFPLRQPFNIYMDKYRDSKEIQKQYFMKKLKTIHPFKESKPPLKYPNAVPFKFDEYIPSWLKLEIRKERLGIGRYREVQE